MRPRLWLAAATLLAASIAAHAEHFQYRVDLSGTHTDGGTEGCTDPFDQPTCPQPGVLSASLSFDTPARGDGVFSITEKFGDITDFLVNLGGLPGDSLYGGVEVKDGAPNGTVATLDGSEYFSFDWASRVVTYTYNYGYHSANGAFVGIMSATPVPEPEPAMLMVAGLAAITSLAGIARRRSSRPLAA